MIPNHSAFNLGKIRKLCAPYVSQDMILHSFPILALMIGLADKTCPQQAEGRRHGIRRPRFVMANPASDARDVERMTEAAE